MARALLVSFDRKFKASLANLKLDPLLYERYVDDTNLTCRAIPRGLVLEENARRQLELVVEAVRARSREERERRSDERTADLY